MVQDPAEWERNTGADTLASLINADLRRNRRVAAAAPVGVAVTDGDVTETFLPQTAFEATAAMPVQPVVEHSRQQLSAEESAARARAGKEAHAEIERSLTTMRQVTELPVPHLATSNDFVRFPLCLRLDNSPSLVSLCCVCNMQVPHPSAQLAGMPFTCRPWPTHCPDTAARWCSCRAGEVSGPRAESMDKRVRIVASAAGGTE